MRKRSAAAWALTGVLAGFAGLAVDYALTEWWNQTGAVVAVADFVRDNMPSGVVNWARENSGKKITIPSILIVMTALFGVIGRFSRDKSWAPTVGFGAVAVLGVVAVLTSNGATVAYVLPVAIGFAAQVGAMAFVGERLRRLQALGEEHLYTDVWRGRRRDFLTVAGAVLGVAVVSSVLGRVLGRDVREVNAERDQILFPEPTEAVTQGADMGAFGVSQPVVPEGARLGIDGVQPWMTPAEDFYLIDTAFSKPALLARDWSLRIHGMVDNEITLTYNDLIGMAGVEAWITLNCVSNEVGGSLIGNAWWSGVLLAPILEQAGIQEGADCILQTSVDGWNCSTPVSAVMDGRNAMLAVAMNGEPLPIEHGYPVRTLVPGLYGYVSGTKWVVDMELTTFDRVDAYWTQRGWGELGPVKIASKVEVPGTGDQVESGEVVIAGTAWCQHTGIKAVEVQVDGGAWTPATLGSVPNDDTWVQWRATVQLEAGDHLAFVRATDADGNVQTSAIADVLPDGATGWDSVEFTTV